MLTEKNIHQTESKRNWSVIWSCPIPMGFQRFKVRSREKNASQQAIT